MINKTKLTYGKLILSFAITAYFIYIIFQKIDISAVSVTLTQIRVVPTFFGLCSLAFGYFLRIFRWQVMLQALKTGASLIECARAFMIGNALNNIFPLRAGDFARVIAFSERLGANRSAVLGTLIIERVMDVIVLLLVFFFVSLMVPQQNLSPDVIRGVSVITLLIILAAIIVIMLPRYIQKISIMMLGRFSENPIFVFYNSVLDSFIGLSSLRITTYLLFLSVMAWLFEGGMYAFIAYALGLKLPLVGAYTSLALGALSTLLPSSPGYFGTFHYFILQAVSIFNVPDDLGAAYALAVHSLMWASITVVGIIFMLTGGKKFLKNPILRDRN